jgi:hypothetical protein
LLVVRPRPRYRRDRARTRFWEFFVSNRIPHTRRAYGSAVHESLAWYEQHGLASIIDVDPGHVGAYIEAHTLQCTGRRAESRIEL